MGVDRKLQGERKEKPDTAHKADEVSKPLDLSLPPQPTRLAPRPGEPGATDPEPILPDLFQLEQEPQDNRATRLKGQVLMEQGAEKSLDTMEGGQITIEMKTR